MNSDSELRDVQELTSNLCQWIARQVFDGTEKRKHIAVAILLVNAHICSEILGLSREAFTMLLQSATCDKPYGLILNGRESIKAQIALLKKQAERGTN
jgi:hypothetical protein